jgi:hypothetical protein
MEDEIKIKLFPVVSHILSSIKIDLPLAIAFGLLAYFSTLGLETRYMSKIELVSAEETEAAVDSFTSMLPFQGLTQNSNNTKKPLRIMTSTPFLTNFIQHYSIDTNLYNDFNFSSLEANSTIDSLKSNENIADLNKIRALALVISSNIEIVDKNPFVTVSLESSSPIISKIVLEKMIEFLNIKMQEKAVKESNDKIDYLTKEIQAVGISDLKNAFSKVIEKAIATASLANMKKDYVFEVIEPAFINKTPTSPNRMLFFAIGLFLGYLILILHRTYIFVSKETQSTY